MGGIINCLMRGLNIQTEILTSREGGSFPFATPNARNSFCKVNLPKLLSDPSSLNSSDSSDQTPKTKFNPKNIKDTKSEHEKHLPIIIFRTKKQLDQQPINKKKLYNSITEQPNRNTLYELKREKSLRLNELKKTVRNRTGENLLKKYVANNSSDVRNSMLGMKVTLLPKKPKGEDSGSHSFEKSSQGTFSSSIRRW